jgi:hypothetical protein
MTMVSSGAISLGGTATSSGLNQSIENELYLAGDGYNSSGTSAISMNDTYVRALAAHNTPGTSVSFSNLYGKTSAFNITCGNTTNIAAKSVYWYFQGWCSYTSGTGLITPALYPGATIGSGPPGPNLNGNTLVGVYQGSTTNGGSGTYYTFILFSGNVSPTVNSVYLNSVSISTSGAAYVYDSTNNVTKWYVSNSSTGFALPSSGSTSIVLT